jgi:hypothetical protein
MAWGFSCVQSEWSDYTMQHPCTAWGMSASQTPPEEESRKFDIHACEAGMNIKFPFFLVDRKRVITGI